MENFCHSYLLREGYLVLLGIGEHVVVIFLRFRFFRHSFLYVSVFKTQEILSAKDAHQVELTFNPFLHHKSFLRIQFHSPTPARFREVSLILCNQDRQQKKIRFDAEYFLAALRGR